MHTGAPLVLIATALTLGGCSQDGSPAQAAPSSAAAPPPPSVTLLDQTTEPAPAGAQPRVSSDPGTLADDLVADEQALRDPSTPGPELQAAARRQQAAYRAIGYHSDWDAITRPRIPARSEERRVGKECRSRWG